MMKSEQKLCRDRLNWGGITNKNRCSCTGFCALDSRTKFPFAATISGCTVHEDEYKEEL